jgi:hypothetical protein
MTHYKQSAFSFHNIQNEENSLSLNLINISPLCKKSFQVRKEGFKNAM